MFWAFIYNVVAIPIAAGVHLLFTKADGGVGAANWVLSVAGSLGSYGQTFINFSLSTLRPEIAGFAMAFSSVSVVTNSLLLRKYTPPMEKVIEREQNKQQRHSLTLRQAVWLIAIAIVLVLVVFWKVIINN